MSDQTDSQEPHNFTGRRQDGIQAGPDVECVICGIPKKLHEYTPPRVHFKVKPVDDKVHVMIDGRWYTLSSGQASKLAGELTGASMVTAAYEGFMKGK
ncbi:hypothetical protein PBI_GRAY_12 [Gordonia phage Gray]|nr:hypothetical protein PBI_GRAY_12 [Gordonia phage Gray]